MPRTPQDGMDYFPHSTNLFDSLGISQMRWRFKHTGYAFYLFLLERIFQSQKFQLVLLAKDTIPILAHQFGVEVEEFNEMLQAALEFELFDPEAYKNEGVLTNDYVKKHVDFVLKRRAAGRRNDE